MLCSLVCLLSFSFVACTQPEGKTDSPTENVVKEGTTKDGSTEVVAEKPGEKPGEPAKEPAKEPIVDSDAATPQEKDPTDTAVQEPAQEPVVPEKTIDNGSPDTTNPDNGSGDELKPPAGSPAVQGNWFMDKMALGFCESLHKRCCGQKKLSPQVAALYGTDIAQCQTRLQMLLKSNSVTDWTRVKFDWKQGKRCVDALAKEQCTPGPKASELCAKTIIGQQKAGEVCGTSQECVSGHFCDKGKKQCVKQAAAGAACARSDGFSCETGYSCSYKTDKCIKSGYTGASCTGGDQAECQPNLSCNQGKCSKTPASRMCQ